MSGLHPRPYTLDPSSRASRSGFTLAELIIAIAIISILVGVYFLVGNPGGQLAESRNTKRSLDLQTLMMSIRQVIADQGNGQFTCASGALPTSTKNMGSASGSYNIAPCLVPTYLYAMPFDPSASSSQYTNNSNYNTGYSIMISSTTGQITLSAPNAELKKVITVTR